MSPALQRCLATNNSPCHRHHHPRKPRTRYNEHHTSPPLILIFILSFRQSPVDQWIDPILLFSVSVMNSIEVDCLSSAGRRPLPQPRDEASPKGGSQEQFRQPQQPSFRQRGREAKVARLRGHQRDRGRYTGTLQWRFKLYRQTFSQTLGIIRGYNVREFQF